MNAILLHPIAETADTVTLRRADYEVIAELLQDAQDAADIDAVIARLAAGETETFPFDVAERLLDGEHPVMVLREHRGVTQAELAAAIGVDVARLADIETGRQIASPETMARLAAALRAPPDFLDTTAA